MQDVLKIATPIIASFFGGGLILYFLKRRKIPKLEFGEFFKEDRQFVTTIRESNRITFFVKVKNVNDKSEGKVKSCTGFINAFGKIHITIWKENGRSEYVFGEEASLQLFYIDKDRKIITFTNSISEKNDKEIIETTELPYTAADKEDLRIRLESDRGHCPSPRNEKIKDIIRKAISK
jgi:hypothetical protein